MNQCLFWCESNREKIYKERKKNKLSKKAVKADLRINCRHNERRITPTATVKLETT
jgi:hypothetical protein